jgi:hypothetical protein
MKWVTIDGDDFKGLLFLDSNPGGNSFNVSVEIFKEKNCYQVQFYIRDHVDEKTKMKKFKTLSPAKKCAEKWFKKKIQAEIKLLKSLL